MKRGHYITFLFLILLIPSANALVEMGDFTKEKYNVGDKVDLDVKVELNKDFKGFFYIKIVCPATTIPLMTKILDLKTNQEVFLEETVSIPDAPGNCNFLAELKGEESDESKPFTITRDLIGIFKVDKNEIQLGQMVRLTGQILRLSQTNVDGKATLSIRNGGEIIDVESVDVDNGVLTYTFNADNVPQGPYSIDTYIFDILGNEMSFGNVTKFDVTGEIKLDVELNKEEILPGEELIVSGSVKYKQLSGASAIQLTVNGENVILNQGGVFSYSYIINEKEKSGQNTLTVTAKDNAGNFGEKTFTYTILPVPTEISLFVPQEEVLPGENLEITSSLYDQAGDKMAGGVKIEVFDKAGNLITTGKGKVSLTIGQFAPPEIMKVKASYEALVSEDEFSVGEKIEFEATTDGTGVIIRNIGNVKFEGEVEILAGSESSFEKLVLRVDETKKISLEDRAGTYELTVLAAGNELNLGEVTITDERSVFSRLTTPLTGNVAGIDGKGTGVLGYMLVAVVLIAFIVGFYFVKARDVEKFEVSREKERREAKLFKARVLRQREESKRRTFGREISPDEAKKFREQFLRNVRSTESKGRNQFI